MKKQNEKSTASIHDIYVLVEMAGEQVKGKTTKAVTLEINLTKMHVGGNDGCNQFGGDIKKHNADKMELEFGNISATEMYCNDMSNKVGQAIYKVKKYKREGLLLHLMTEKDEVLLTYKKVD